ncbi:MAG TPA: hypothetical protein VI356_17550 [Myxococcales bacterium]
MIARLASLALFASLPALAWEPETPAAVQARITELQQAWQGKSAAQIAQDKVARARQPRPQWVDKTAWKLELGPVTYYFAVGKAAFHTAAVAAKAPAPAASSGRPLDWWYDDAAGAFYTLVVDAR